MHSVLLCTGGMKKKRSEKKEVDIDRQPLMEHMHRMMQWISMCL